MTSTSLIAIIIAAALVNNVVLSQFLGICSFLGVSSQIKTSASLGGAVIFVITIASAVANILYTFILDVAFKLEVDYAIALLYGLVGAAADIFGDLMFSAIKRQTGIKDYGNLIPGHGGILDRFDSMMTVGPLVEALLVLLPVVGV